MKKIKLTPKNLIKLGLTKEIFENDFENWLNKNNDFYVDYDREEIAIGIKELKNDVNNCVELLKNEYINDGGTADEFVEKTDEYKLKLKEKIVNVLNSIPDEMKREFLINTLQSNHSELKIFKNKIFDEKLNVILGEPSENEIVSTPNADILENENKYPRIFKDYYSYSVFKNLHDEFGNSNENMSNYSYVFHKMTYEGLIHYDLLQKTYVEMLSDFDISIERIKPMAEIGKKDLRDSIYDKAK